MAKRYTKTIEYIKLGKTQSGAPKARIGFGNDLYLNAMGDDYKAVKGLSKGDVIEFEVGMVDNEPTWCNKVEVVGGRSNSAAPDPDEFDPFADPPEKKVQAKVHAAPQRSEKDVLIVNQSCLKAAIEFGIASKSDADEILRTAQRFADWVFNYEPKNTFELAEE